MSQLIFEYIKEKDFVIFKDFFYHLFRNKDKFYLHQDIASEWDGFNQKIPQKKGDSVAEFILRIQELFVIDGVMKIFRRVDIADYEYFTLNISDNSLETISNEEYLRAKDDYVLKGAHTSQSLKIDLSCFNSFFPLIRDSSQVGNGMRFLNRHLSSSFFQNPDKWNQCLFDFLKIHKMGDESILVNQSMNSDLKVFHKNLLSLLKQLKKIDKDEKFSEVKGIMEKHGFLKGWGSHVEIIIETLGMLKDLFNEPSSAALEKFISRIPMVSKIAIISPHGWFGQENVLGKPDTGGQVIYILDQVKALERTLKKKFNSSGLDLEPKIIVLTRLIPESEGTQSHVRLEKIFHTDNSYILRVPFKDQNEQVVQHWLSRFRIWPYLDQFAKDSEKELFYEFKSKPDLIIGNYSDGNLVASLLSDTFGSTLCTIAHALEKAKYLFSDLYWKDMDDHYHFTLQFTADLLAMNKSDFIIASTFQEIAGTENTVGQYESYQSFTMPDFFQVLSGVNLLHPKFNVIPPGVDEDNYYPYHNKQRRLSTKLEYCEKRLFLDDSPDIFGVFDDPHKPPVFTMARLDRIKNLTGLVEAFGQSEFLKSKMNLIVAGGTTDYNESKDDEEKAEIQKVYSLIDQYNLRGHIRWLPKIEKKITGEMYRVIADRKGIFVQPALFEAFGLTVLEAMLCGLPTFGPLFGGPSEIIEDAKNGFLMDTSHSEGIKKILEDFVKRFEESPHHWDDISKAGVKRVREHFTWNLYSDKLLTLTKLYGFWRYSVANKGKVVLNRYCELLYEFLCKNRSKEMF